MAKSDISQTDPAHPIAPGEFDDTLTSPADCRDLWAAKLMAYMHDALRPEKLGINLRPDVAQGWFGTRDFRLTCECAGLHPEKVMETYHTRLALTQQGRWEEALDGLVQKKANK
jgi:hypothetical protein